MQSWGKRLRKLERFLNFEEDEKPVVFYVPVDCKCPLLGHDLPAGEIDECKIFEEKFKAIKRPGGGVYTVGKASGDIVLDCLDTCPYE